jgi:hypothetical protein
VGGHFFPLDERLELMDGHFTPRVQEAMVRLGTRMTYGEAAEELERLWGVAVHRGTIRSQTMAYGQAAMELVDETVEELEATAPPAKAMPNQLQMSTDGAFVQLTNGDWREVKTATFGEFQSQWDAKNKQMVVKTNHLSYFSRLEPAETFARHLLYEWHQRGGENAQRVVAVNDGAAWIQSLIDYHCPEAVRVIDFRHAQSYVATIGKSVHGPETEAFKQWYATASAQLIHRPPPELLANLRQLQNQHDPQQANEEIKQALHYLETRPDQIHYAHFRAQQVPIGSGIGESGNKVVMQRRLKQAGMRWADSSINPLLTLRSHLCSQRWDAAWSEVYEVRLAQRRQKRLPQPPQPVSPSPPLTLASVQVAPSPLTIHPTEHPTPSPPKKSHPWRNNKWPIRCRY